MKNLITYSIFLLCAVTAFGQSPEKISYQAIVRDADGNLLKNTEISLKVSLIQGLDDDAMVYEEDHSTITNTNGLVSIEIGMGETANDFGNIDWSLGSYLLQTDIDPEGGTNYSISNVSQLLSVPFSLHANTADSLVGGISEGDPVFIAWDKSAGIIISEAQISDLKKYLVEEKDSSVSNEIQSLAQVLAVNDSADSQIKNVTDPTDAQDAATKAYVDILIGIVDSLSGELSDARAIIDANGLSNTVKDIDGNIYKTVTIGDQIWMAENLRTSRYNTGADITYISDNALWGSTSSGAYSWYQNNPTSTGIMHGAIYNGYTINTKTLCPSEWHVPTKTDFETLVATLGGESLAGGKLKELGTITWTDVNKGDTNNSGFAGRGTGRRAYNTGEYEQFGILGNYWSSTISGSVYNNYLYLRNDNTEAVIGGGHRNYGMSVRCIKD